MCKKCNSVFDSLKLHGDDSGFREPKPTLSKPTNCRPGSDEKMRVLQERVRLGLPLHVTGESINELDDSTLLEGKPKIQNRRLRMN